MARTKHAASRFGAKKTIKTSNGSGAGDTDKVRKKRRYRPGTVALREIRQFQKRTDLLIPKAPFRRLVREIGQNFKHELRFSAETFDAIQSVAESYLTNKLRSANKAAIHAKRKGITKSDMEFAIRQAANPDEE